MLDPETRRELAKMPNAQLKDFLEHSQDASADVRKAARTEAIVRGLDVPTSPCQSLQRST